MSSSLILQKWSAHLTWMVCRIGGKWPYTNCFVGCYFQDLFKRAFWYSSTPGVSLDVSLESKWCNHTVVLISNKIKQEFF